MDSMILFERLGDFRHNYKYTDTTTVNKMNMFKKMNFLQRSTEMGFRVLWVLLPGEEGQPGRGREEGRRRGQRGALRRGRGGLRANHRL